MTANLPESCRQLIDLQRGVLARWQAQEIGLDSSAIRWQLDSGRWMPLQRGVYATFTGKPSWESVCWAAVLRAGPEAVLSHQTAAELDGLTSARSPVIHVSVPSASAPSRSQEYAFTGRCGWLRRGILPEHRPAPGSRRPFST